MIKDVEFVVKSIADTALKNEQYFTELDAVVGDGDFGYSLARGFEKVLEKWDEIDRTNPGAFLKENAKIIMSSVGGVSGTIWGTAFLRAGMTIGTNDTVTKEDIGPMLRAVIEGIKKRGNCELGDKTYLDTLIPTTDAIEAAISEGKDALAILDIAAQVSADAAEATRPMIAKRGRASYTGERSIGTLDAGSVALATMIKALSEDWRV
ncbi:MAG: dihydroxyacetone kinase subunit DhaL [Anaerolineaceae bacterium]|jgi:dihydroxyacetone kinase/dihydroxyacetone kinase-like protein|nr:dihydroxyacetone kinase subunit DhaL [Anaerolineaceae bacterium]MDD4042162.1 dihydroxyacetone kinase subunit DhaL [Anaerolineaceae bacterium]MDD4576998.1 dihydroxyacetone kinase subunit DhaL [Anaerolineaceae bacterium]